MEVFTQRLEEVCLVGGFEVGVVSGCGLMGGCGLSIESSVFYFFRNSVLQC